MLTLETLTEAGIRGLFNDRVWARAHSILHAVQRPIRRGNQLDAVVMGAQLYEVLITVKPDHIAAVCTCPDDRSGFCRHAGAVLRLWIQAPGMFTVQTAKGEPATDETVTIKVIPVPPPATRQSAKLPDWMRISFVQEGRQDRKALSETLQEFIVRDLRDIGSNRGWRLRGARKDEIIEQLVEKMADADECHRTVEGLDKEHAVFLQALTLINDLPGLDNEDIEEIGKQLGMPPTEHSTNWYLRSLTGMGLVAYSTDHNNIHQSRYIPRAIERVLPPQPALTAVEPTTDDSHVEISTASPDLLLQSIRQLLIALTKIETSLRTPMPRPALERYNDAFKGWDYNPAEVSQFEGKGVGYGTVYLTAPPPAYALPDETIEGLLPFAGSKERLDFLYAILLRAGVFQPGSPVTAWPDVYKEFLRRDLADQHAILARAYFGMDEWTELWAILRTQPGYRMQRRWSASYGRLTPENLRNDLVTYRRLVLRALLSLPDGEWVAFDELFTLLRSYWDRFDNTLLSKYSRRTPQASVQRSWQLDYRGTILSDPTVPHFNTLQEAFVHFILEGPLHWLGLADLNRRDGVLTHVRLHGLADLFLGRKEHVSWAAATPGATGRSDKPLYTVEADLIHVDPVAVTILGHAVLERCAILEEMAPDRFTYRIDPVTVHQTFEAGETLEKIYADWETHLLSPAPPSIRERLDHWWAAYGQVRIYDDVTVIEFGDDHALAEMKAVTSLGSLPYAEISPRLVMIPRLTADHLIAELEKAGYTPRKIEN